MSNLSLKVYGMHGNDVLVKAVDVGQLIAPMLESLESKLKKADLILDELLTELNDIVKLGLDDDCKINIESLKQLLAKARGEL